eukprot:12352448-Alexandrium_andersonii.AAC.1
MLYGANVSMSSAAFLDAGSAQMLWRARPGPRCKVLEVKSALKLLSSVRSLTSRESVELSSPNFTRKGPVATRPFAAQAA